MARSKREFIDWWDHRFALVVGFVVFVAVCIHILAWLLLPPGPTVRSTEGGDGRTTNEYVRPESTRPFRVTVLEGGRQVEQWFDRNENGLFESRHYYQDGEPTEQHVSLADDGVYDVKRLIQGLDMLEMVDHDRDGIFEEKHWLRDGKRVRDEVDRDGDGQPEQRVLYDDAGHLNRLELVGTAPRAVDVGPVRHGGQRQQQQP